MGKVIRVALPGYNALTDNDPRHFSIMSDQDNILIKELKRGSGSVDINQTATIAHNLGYIPFFMVYCEVEEDVTNKYRLINSFDPLGNGWRAYADNNNLYIRNLYSDYYTTYRYIIFYDNIT